MNNPSTEAVDDKRSTVPSRHGKELYDIAPDATLMAVSVSIREGRFEAGTPTPLFQTRKVGGGANADSTPTPITLLMNWKP